MITNGLDFDCFAIIPTRLIEIVKMYNHVIFSRLDLSSFMAYALSSTCMKCIRLVLGLSAKTLQIHEKRMNTILIMYFYEP